MVIPYKKGVTEKVKRVERKYGFTIVFTKARLKRINMNKTKG